MAVMKMKLISLVGPIEQFDEVIEKHIVNLDFHLEDVHTVIKDIKGFLPFDNNNSYTPVLKAALSLAEKYNIPLDYREFTGKGYGLESSKEYIDGLLSELNDINIKKTEAETLIAENKGVINQLLPLENLTLNLDYLTNVKFVKFRFGRIPNDVYKTYQGNIDNNDKVFFYMTSREKDYVYCMYMMPREYIEEADAFFSKLHFERIRISEKAHGTPAEAIIQLKNQIYEFEKTKSESEHIYNELFKREIEKFLSIYSYIKFMSDTHDISKLCSHTKNSFYILAWLPEDSLKVFLEEIKEMPEIEHTVEDPSILNGGHGPPIKLKNFRIFKPFEMLVNTYGLPAYNEIDPTPLIGITYPILFGIMFGDVGQGIFLILICIIYARLKKSNLAKIGVLAGICSTVFGFVYGSVFGSEEILPYQGFQPLENDNVNTLLLAAIGIGVVLMTVAMIMNIFNGIKQKDIEKTYFSAKGIAGIILYWSILTAAVSLLISGINVMNPVYVILLIVLPLITIYLAQPLTKLLKKKHDWIPKEGSFFVISFFELFEVLMSFLSNTVSFLRLGALALNHAGMMLVVYMLAQNVDGSHNIIVIIIGNILVSALEVLIVGIQALRLEFYEIFNKFYSGTDRKSVV